MANPSVVTGNTNSGSFTSGTSVTVSSTGSVTAGNLMMCVLTVGGASAPSALAPPAGWTTFLATTANTSAGLIVTAIFYRAQPTTGAFSGSFTWTTTATSGSWGFFVLNQPGALLVDGTVVTAQNASGTKTSPTITPAAGKVNDTLICAIIGAVVGTDTITQPAGMTSVLSISGTASQQFFSIASLGLASASATGTQTWSFPTSRTCLGVSLLVQQGPIWGFNVVNDAAPALPSVQSNRIARAAAAFGKSQFASFDLLRMGWEVQPPQPMPTKQFRAGAIAIGDPGNQAKFIGPVGATTPPVFEVQLPTLRVGSPILSKRGAAASGKSSFAAFNMPPWTEVQSLQPPQFPRARQRYVGSKGSAQFRIFQDLVKMGWEVQPLQTPRPARHLSDLLGDPGKAAAAAPPPAPPAGWEMQSAPIRVSPPKQRAAAASGRSSFAAFNMRPFTEIQSWQPPRYPAPRQRYAATKGNVQFRIFPDFAKMNWELQPQPLYPRAAHRGAMVPGDQGNQAKFIPPVTGAILWGLDQTPFAKRNVYRAGTFTERDVETPLINFFPFGWMVQPLQPGHPAPERRAGAIARGDDGNAAQQINFFPAGWQIQPHQPQHPRPERAGSIMVGEPGNEAVFSFIAPVFIPDGYNPTPFMPRVRFARAGSLARGEDGTEGLYSVWLPSGWQIPDPAQRPRRGTAGAIQEEWRGEQPLQAATSWGFEFPIAMLRRAAPRQPDQAATVLIAGTTAAVTISWGDFNPDVRLPTRRRANFDQAPFVPGALAVFTWGDLDPGVTTKARRRLRPDDSPFSPHALGARFQWGQIDPPITFPTRRRTLTRAEFYIEGQFVFVPPPPVTYNCNPDNLLRRTLFNPGAAIMQFDGGWFQERYVDVFFASSIITQASGDTAVTAASGQTVLSNQA